MCNTQQQNRIYFSTWMKTNVKSTQSKFAHEYPQLLIMSKKQTSKKCYYCILLTNIYVLHHIQSLKKSYFQYSVAYEITFPCTVFLSLGISKVSVGQNRTYLFVLYIAVIINYWYYKIRRWTISMTWNIFNLL